MQFQHYTLPNGLEIIAECNPAAYSTALGFFVRTGARDEPEALAGVSHFLEHMVFKGTARRSADDVNREFDEMGAHYNAFTSEENTVYYASVLPEHQDQAVELLADILRPTLRDEDFEIEKQVIQEEIRMYEDQPPFGADDRCRALYFNTHPLGHSVIGTASSIGGLTPQAMKEYFHCRYSPVNIVLVGTGRIDFDALVAAARRCCGEWQPVAATRVVDPVKPHSGFHLLRRETATQQYTLQLSPAPAAEDDARYAVRLLATVLGDDSGSRLYWELVDPGLAESAVVHYGEHQGAGILMTCMTCEPEQTADNLRRIARLFRETEDRGVTEAELQQAKSKIRSRIVLSAERPRGRLFALGNEWVYRRQYRTIGEELDTVNAVTLEDLAAMLAHYSLCRPMTVSIGPLADLPPPM